MRSEHSRLAFAALDNLIDNHYIHSMRQNDMISLAQYLRERNAATEAWVAEDPANRWASTYTEDLAHWAEIGVLSVRDFMRYEMETQYSELHKDACGFRPHVDTSKWSYDQLVEETDRLFDYLNAQIDREAEYEYQSMIWAQEDAEAENALRDEMPLPIDYIAANYQDGWL